jgi:hypothetical protein
MPPQDVGAAAGTDRHDQPHRACRKILRSRGSGEDDAERDAGNPAPSAHGAAC